MTMDLKTLREKWDDNFIINGGDPNTADKLEVLALIDELEKARAELEEWAMKDGNSPGYNLAKAKTYGTLAGKFKDALRNAEAPHKRGCSRPYLNQAARCSCGLDALLEAAK